MDAEDADLRMRVPKKLRFPADATFVSVGAISRKWGISRNQAFKLVTERYGMTRLRVSRMAVRRVYRVDVAEYYRATIERLEFGVLADPRKPDPGLFGDSNQFNRDVL